VEDSQTLMEVARRETGLRDFGADSFREGLELLVASLNREARLNASGEYVLRERILGHLKQRLHIEEWYRRNPQIDEEIILRPLIGLGLPRTGSTALSFLLAQDPNARSLLRTEAAKPCPPPGTLPETERAQEQDAAEKVAGWKPHTPSGDSAPAECQDLMALDFKSQIFLAFARIPAYAQWLNNADMSSCYAYERRALKLLQWRRPAKPWRLKAPTHLLYLNALNTAFPDARFVMTHRDPTDVMLSVIDVYTDIISKFSDMLDKDYIAELNIGMWSQGMQRALAFRDQGSNSERFFDIHFKAMQDDPAGEVRKLYKWLDEPVTEQFARCMADWWQDNADSREPGASKRAEDYGVDLSRVRPLFAEYTQRMQAWTGGAEPWQVT
jgi:hypothetical protein